MSAIQPVPGQERPLFVRPAPGYFTTTRVLKRLRRFQNVVRHKERWAPDMQFACPIEELVPAKIPMPERFQLLDREIHRMMHIIRRDINYAGVTTSVIHKHWDLVENKRKEDRYDVILDYFHLPRGQSAHQAYEAVMAHLEQAIGVYEGRSRQAKRDLFNPLVWTAHLIRIPITVMEHAGMVGHEKTADMVLGGYAKFVKIAMSVIIGLIALLLGVKVPWRDMFVRILELIAK
jgi:hypothetical protein